MLRWNEILLELVARADLPPAPNPDGTYPVPDPNNPFADPQFPFGNPPYAARAYSYVTVAQFEALKVAWYYKYLYNRPSPSKVDSGVQALIPTNDLPAYPSEDAVMSGVNAELLKLLFPAFVEEITRKAGEQRTGGAAVGKGHGQRHRCGRGIGAGRSPGVHRARRLGWHGGRRRLARAVAVAGGRGRGARGDSLEEHGHPASSADAPVVRKGQGLDDDAGRHRQGTAGTAAVNVIGPDGAGIGRGQASS